MNKFRRFFGVFLFILVFSLGAFFLLGTEKEETINSKNFEAKYKVVEEISKTPIVYAWLSESVDNRIEKTIIAKEEKLEEKRLKIEDQKLLNYVMEVSKLSEEDSKYLINRCEELNLETFLMLGLIKAESSFNTMLVGSSGERGLGQIMNGTGKFICENLGIKYDRDKLFEPQYNIMLSTYYIDKLRDYYDGNIHMILTAYNRGQGGLQKYIASRSHLDNPQESGYSKTVLKYGNEFRDEYNKINNN
jgi:hypothetical protein